MQPHLCHNYNLIIHMIISFCKTSVAHQKLCSKNISLNFVISNSYTSMLEIFEEDQLSHLKNEFF